MGQVWSSDLGTASALYLSRNKRCTERLQLSGAFLRDPFPYGVLLDQNIPINQLYNGYTIVPYGAGAATLPPNVVTVSAPANPVRIRWLCETDVLLFSSCRASTRHPI